MSEGPLSYLSRQREISWRLLELHLSGLTDEEALWKPAPIGLHVHRADDHRWTADWPGREDYGVGPPSIAWLTWHVGFWWSMVLNHTFGDARLRREDVFWPGSVEATRAWLTECERGWGEAIAPLTDADLAATTLTRWPMAGRPFGDVVAWVNLELMKSAAEIGYVRFLHAASS